MQYKTVQKEFGQISSDGIWDIIKERESDIYQKIRSRFWLKLGCFDVSLDETRKRVLINRPNPFWFKAFLDIEPNNSGCLARYGITPSMFLFDVFSLLILLFFGFIFVTEFDSGLFLSIPIAFVLIVITINRYIANCMLKIFEKILNDVDKTIGNESG